MKRLKEINLAPSIDRGDSPHVRAKQPLGISGYSGGMRDSAISTYSSWMGSKKVTLEEDEEDKETEELESEIDLMPENILKFRVRNEKGYSLNETLRLINHEPLSESFIGDRIQSIIKVGLMSILDDVTGELSGIISVLPLLYKNVYELHSTNSKLESLISNGSKDEKAFKEIRTSLSTDLKDIIEAIIIAVPAPGLDSMLAGLVSIINPDTIGSASVYLGEKYAKLEKFNPKLAKVFKYLGYMLGFPVISKAMENIDNLSDDMLATTMSGTAVLKSYEKIPEHNIETIVQDEINESVKNLTSGNLDKNDSIEENYYGIDEDMYADLDEEELEDVEEHAVGGYATTLKSPTKAQQKKLMTFKEDLQRLQNWKLKTTGRTRN